MDETIYEKIYAWDNLLAAYHEAAKEKWFRQDVATFTAQRSGTGSASSAFRSTQTGEK